MNTVILHGKLGADPELKYTQNGTAVCKLRVATSKVWYNKQNQKQEETQWHTCIAWQKQAETINKHFAKGDSILLTGELQYRQWEDKNGSNHTSAEIRIDRFEFSAKAQGNQRSGGGGGYGGGGYGGGYESGEDFGDDDIPF